jgi:hypothetical protein
MFQLENEPPMVRTASFSRCDRYRFELQRVWNGRLERVHFVLLNPSTADTLIDDATVRRCIGFARRWSFGGIIITNLFALRSTDPAALKRHVDPIGPRNDEWIAHAVGKAGLTILAWGIHGELLGRDRTIGSLLDSLDCSPKCFGRTKCGAPLHPLYLRADHPLEAWQAGVRCQGVGVSDEEGCNGR